MNPPTPGHLILIGKMIQHAIETGSEKIYVITSTTMDGKNPVPCSKSTIPKPKTKADLGIISSISGSDELIYKSNVLNDMIESYRQQLVDSEADQTKKIHIQNLNIIVICSFGCPFGTINGIIQRDFISKEITDINLFFVVGRDRADFLDTIIDNYKSREYIASADGELLGREGMNELKLNCTEIQDISQIKPEQYSASFVRCLVKNNMRPLFQQVYSDYLNTEEINKLYETINLGMNLKPPSAKSEDENPPTKYFVEDSENPSNYIKRGLPIINTKNGGKKNKRKTRNKRKTKRKTRNKRKT
jgi:hypothetical protein